MVVLFPPFAYGTGTYVGIFSTPICVFSVGLAGFLLFGFFSAFTRGLLLSFSLGFVNGVS